MQYCYSWTRRDLIHFHWKWYKEAYAVRSLLEVWNENEIKPFVKMRLICNHIRCLLPNDELCLDIVSCYYFRVFLSDASVLENPVSYWFSRKIPRCCYWPRGANFIYSKQEVYSTVVVFTRSICKFWLLIN